MNSFVRLSGRVVILNSLLNLIVLFFISFMNISLLVWKNMVGMQGSFLLGGSKGGNKVAWLKW